MTESFKNNTTAKRFEYTVDSHTAFANYRIENGLLYIDYVEAPPLLRGTGAAGKLMQNILDEAYAAKLKVVPVCSYAIAWMRRNKAA